MIRHQRLLSLLFVALAGCTTAESPDASTSAPSGAASSAPSGTPSGGDEPSSSAAASPDLAATEGEILNVVADELRVRAEAGTDATLVDTLDRDTPVRVVSGPVDADGFTWLEIVAIDGRGGWAATGDGEDPWLAAPPDLSDATPILTLDRVCDVVGPIVMPLTTVFDDGHVIAQDPESSYTRWIVRQLSASGMQTIRDDVLGSPYLQASGNYEPQAKPGAEPPGHGGCLYTFTIPSTGEPIVVTSVNWFGDEEESTFYQPSPERKALDGIGQNLVEIHDVLPDADWAGEAVPWVATEYAVGIGPPQPDPAPDDSPSVDPADLGLGDLDEFRTPMAGDACVIAPERAFEVIRALLSASVDLRPSLQPAIGLDVISFGSFATSDGWMGIVLSPRSHDDRPDCASLPI